LWSPTCRRLPHDDLRRVRYQDVGRHRVATQGKTVLETDSDGLVEIGPLASEQAQLNTKRLTDFFAGDGEPNLRIEVAPCYWGAALAALIACLAFGGLLRLVWREVQELAAYRIEVYEHPPEGRHLCISRRLFGLKLGTKVLSVPTHLVGVFVERGPMHDWSLTRGQAPTLGGRLVLTTARGEALPIIPSVRRGLDVHERAAVTLAKCLGL
jgi:hypothetical protein